MVYDPLRYFTLNANWLLQAIFLISNPTYKMFYELNDIFSPELQIGCYDIMHMGVKRQIRSYKVTYVKCL